MSARWTLAVLAASALSLSVLAAVLGAADLAADNARSTLSGWRDSGRMGNGQGWASLAARLQLARRIEPRDAGHRAAIAELLSWWLIAALPETRSRTEVLRAARAEQLAALARRPTWAMAWARLADLDYLAGRGARDVFPALERAAALGPFEPGVQFVIGRVGLGLWDGLDPAQRGLVEEAVRRSLASGSNRRPFALLALHHGRVEWLAGLSSDPAYRAELTRMQTDARR